MRPWPASVRRFCARDLLEGDRSELRHRGITAVIPEPRDQSKTIANNAALVVAGQSATNTERYKRRNVVAADP